MITLLFAFLTAFTQTSPRVDAYGDPLPPGAVARFGSVRWRAPETVTSLMFTPDGRFLIGQLCGPSFVIWSYPDGKRVGAFDLPLVRSVDSDEPDEPFQFRPELWRFDPEGRMAYVHYGWDRVYRLKLLGGKIERVDEGERLEACGMSGNGSRLLLSTPFEVDDAADAHLWLKRPKTGGLTKVDTLPRQYANTKRLCATGRAYLPAPPVLSADGRFAAAGFLTSVPNLMPVYGFTAYDLLTGQSWSTRMDGYIDYQFTPDGRGLVVADSREVSMWRYITTPGGRTRFDKVATHRLSGYRDCGSELQRLAVNRQRIVVRNSDQKITVLNSDTMRRERVISLPDDYSWRNGLAVSPDGGTLAFSADSPPRIAFFNLETGRAIRPTAGHTLAIKTLESDPAGRRLLSYSADGALRVWDLNSGRQVACRHVGSEAGGFLISRGGQVVYFRNGDGDIRRWEIGARAPTLLLRGHEIVGQPWLSTDGQEILFNDGTEHLVRQPLTGPLRDLPAFPVNGSVWRVDYEVPGPGVTIYQGNERLRYDRHSGEQLPRTEVLPVVAERYFVNCYRIGARIEIRDGVTLQSKYLDEPRLDDESKEDATHIVGSVTADARFFAYAAGGSAVVRDLDTGEEVKSFGRPDATTTTATLSPSGNHLIAGYSDGQILMWNLRAVPAATNDADRLWSDLGADVGTARRAAARMAADPKFAIAVLRDRVRPFTRASEDEICKWVGELDHSRFVVRERATRQLALHYDCAKEILEMAGTEQLSAEMRERLARVQDIAKGPIIDESVLRLVRAVAVLEQVPGGDATALLQRIAEAEGLPAVRAGDALVRRALDRQ